MRNTAPLLFAFLLWSLCGCESYAIRRLLSREYFVTASVLLVREKPGQGARVMNALPYGTRFEAMEIGNEVIIDGRAGRWLRLKTLGYVYGGYAQRVAPPESATLGLHLTHQSASIVCESDTSRFTTTRLFLSSGRATYSFRDFGHCTGPDTKVKARGRYELTENGVRVSIARGSSSTRNDICGVQLNPAKASSQGESRPFDLAFSWRPDVGAFVPVEEPVPDLPYSPQVCAFHPRDVRPSADSRSMCSGPQLRSFFLAGTYCPGWQKEWN
jgi:hypothetical protein